MNVLFDVDDKREPKPTLRQWLNTNGKRKLAQQYPVLKVWKPGKYQSIVFETDRFRAILYDGNPLFGKVAKELDAMCSGAYGLAISVNERDPGSFKIVAMDNENPTVRSIGEFGYEFFY